MAASKEVISANEPRMVISRRNTSNGLERDLVVRGGHTVDEHGAAVAGEGHADVADGADPVASTTMS